MKRTPGDRLKALRVTRGYESAQAAAEAFGWTVVTYRSHENGTRSITYAAAQKYSLAFGTKVSAILGDDEVSELAFVSAPINVPLLGTVSAGVFREGTALEDMEISVPAVPRPDIPASAQYCLRVEGPSVNLRIPDGAYAICVRFDRYPGGAKHGQLVHVVRERHGLVENTIKEMRYEASGRVLAPVSSDPKHQAPISLSGQDADTVIRIEGIVIGKFEPI